MAENAGVYWISLWDHFYDNPSLEGNGDCFEAVSMLAALASSTSKVRVGCLVFSTTYRNPAILAKIAVTIDHISGGRLELGLGAGWFELEHLAYGIPFPPTGIRLDMLEESVKIIKSMLTKDSTTFHGKHFSVENAVCNPKPIQNPLPMYSPGRNPGSLRRIAKNSMGYLIRNSEAQDRLEAIKPFLTEYGRDISELDVVAESHLSLASTHQDAVTNYQNSRLGDRSKSMNIGDMNKVISDNWIGTVNEVVEKIVSTKEMGISKGISSIPIPLKTRLTSLAISFIWFWFFTIFG